MTYQKRRKKRKIGRRGSSVNRTRRGEQSRPINFLKIKIFICFLIFISVVCIHQLNVKVGDFTSEKLYDMLYYNEDIRDFNERYLNYDWNSIKNFWNSQ